MKHLFLGVFIAFSFGCAKSTLINNSSSQIYGGTVAKAQEYDWVGGVRYGFGAYATGSALCPNVILSAAHAISYRTAGEVCFQLGKNLTLEYSLAPVKEKVCIPIEETFLIDERYYDWEWKAGRTERSADIALGRLKTPILGIGKFLANSEAALEQTIARENQLPAEGDLCTMSGFGRYDWLDPTGFLRFAAFRIEKIESYTEGKLFELVSHKTGSSITVGMSGDSGSPMSHCGSQNATPGSQMPIAAVFVSGYGNSTTPWEKLTMQAAVVAPHRAKLLAKAKEWCGY